MIPGFILAPLAKAADVSLAVVWEITAMTWQYLSRKIDR